MLRETTPGNALANFSNTNGVVIVKRSTGKFYIKLRNQKSYAKMEDNKLVFASSDNASGFMSDAYDYEVVDDKKLRLLFTREELNNFDFYLITDEVDDYDDVVRDLLQIRSTASKTAPSNGVTKEPVKKTVVPQETKSPTVNLTINITAPSTATQRAAMFRNLLNA